MSFYDSKLADKAARTLVLQVRRVVFGTRSSQLMFVFRSQILERACSIPESLRALLEQHGLLTWVRAALSDGGSGSGSGSGRAPLSQLQPLLSLLRKVAELLPEYHSSRVDERLVRKEADAKAAKEAKEHAGKGDDEAADGVADMDSSEDGEDDESAGDRIELKRKSPLDRVRCSLVSSPSGTCLLILARPVVHSGSAASCHAAAGALAVPAVPRRSPRSVLASLHFARCKCVPMDCSWCR